MRALLCLIRPSICGFGRIHVVLNEIAERTGGDELDASKAPLELGAGDFRKSTDKAEQSADLRWVFMMLACLLPLDVALRRVQLDFGWIRQSLPP